MGSHSSKDNSHKTNSLTRSLSDGGILARFKYKRNKHKNNNNNNNSNSNSKSKNIRQKSKSLRLSNPKSNPTTNSKTLLFSPPSSPPAPSSPQPQNNPNITNLPAIKLTSPYQLPDIESIKSSRNKDKLSSSKDVSEPRRSLQNSIAGIKQLNHYNHSHNPISISHSHTQSTSSNTHLRGFFNIPVPIDNNISDSSNNDQSPSNEIIDTNTIITNNTTPTNNTHTNKPLHNLITTPIHNSDTEDTNNSTSIIGTILSFAHTAMGHHANKTSNNSANSILPSISNLSYSINGNNHTHEDTDSIQRDLTNNNGRVHDAAAANANNSVIHHTHQSILNNGSNMTALNISNTKSGGQTNTTINNRTTTSTAANAAANNTTKPAPNRSTSFLRHLDSLLSPGNPLLTSNTSTSSLSTKDIIVNNNDGVSTLYTNTKKSNNNSNISNNDTAINEQSELTTLNKVKFEPINSLSNVSPDPPTITTLGHGNLTLDLFEDTSSHTKLHTSAHLMSSDSLIMENNNNINTVNNVNGSELKNENEENTSLILKNGTTNLSNNQMAAANRNSSYVDVSKHNPLSAYNRERSKTLPAKNVLNVEYMKRNSRYSSLSNDEHLEINNNNLVPTSNIPSERKARSMSRTFLNRRSFSPNIIKVIPNINLRPSMNKVRNSTEVAETRNLSASFDNMIDPVVNFDYNKPAELVGVEYSSEKKNAEFHNLFKDSGISPDEKLIVDHSCALSRDILLQGRIYISNQHLCFYSNILGWVSSVIIPFKEIVQIEKKTTAGIFPNGIVIDTLHSKYTFASFISRDATFDLITDVWNQIILGRRYVKIAESDENLSDSHSSLSLSNSSGSSSFNDEMDGDNDIDDYEEDDINDTDMTSSDELDDESLLALSKRNKSNTLVTTNHFPGPVTHAATKSDYKPESNERLISEVVINAPLGQVAQILYGDDVNKLTAILKAQANFDLSPIPPLLKNKSREYSYYKPLHFGFGPSKTKCLIVDKVIKYDLEDYVQVFQESKTPDVPSGNSFTIRTNTILTWDTDNRTKITTYFLAEWSSKSWLKGAIEKGAFDGVVNTTKIQNNEISKYVKEDLTKSPTKRGLSQSKKNRVSVDENEEPDNMLGALPTLGPLTHEPTEPEYLKGNNDVIISNDVIFNAPLGTIFQLLYGDNTSYLKQILEKQNAFDISTIPSFTNKEREYKYIKKLNNTMGPKQTKCTITEKIEHMDIDHYICVRQIVVSHDVPSGNAFSVHTRFFFYWGPSNTTKMLVVLNVVWTGKSFIKGAIEKGSIDGQKTSCTIIKEQLTSIISNLSEKKTKKRSKTIRSRSTTTINEVEEPTKPEEMTNFTQEEFSTGIFNWLFSLWESFDIFSIKGIMSVVLGLFVFIILFRSIFHIDTAQHDLRLISRGRILIDGYEYTYAPNFKTLYQVYEDEIRSTVRSSKKYSVKSARNMIVSSQRSLSKWLEERGYGPVKTQLLRGLEEMNVNADDSQTNIKNNKDYEIKKLLESIKITELQLNEMKDTLASLQA